MITHKVTLDKNEWAYIIKNGDHVAIVFSNGTMEMTRDSRSVIEIGEALRGIAGIAVNL